jgi:hypothetical protein
LYSDGETDNRNDESRKGVLLSMGLVVLFYFIFYFFALGVVERETLAS